MRRQLATLAPSGLRAVVRPPIRLARRAGYVRARIPPPVGTRPEITLAVCAIMRDEAPYLAEWVTFHRLMGVERFYLYENFSSDDWRAALAPELQSCIAEVVDWPFEPGQFTAYNDCLARHRRDTRWIAFLDVDEFLFSPTGRPLPDVLLHYDTYPGVVVNWRTFGSSGHIKRPEGLVIERFLTRAADDRPVNHWVKSIVYPRKTEGVSGTPHTFNHYGLAVDERRSPRIDASPYRAPPTTEVLRINHYYAKSEEELQRKIARGRADKEGQRDQSETDDLVRHADEVSDDTILRFLPALKHELAARGSSVTIRSPARGSPARAEAPKGSPPGSLRRPRC